MTLPFAFIFIAAFVIVAAFLIIRKNTGKKETKKTESRQNEPQGPVDTSEMEESFKRPLRDKK